MSAFALWYYSKMKPKSHTSPAPKPLAAMAIVAAVRRVHKRMGIDMMPARQSAVLQALQRGFMARHGAESLVPKRKEPLDLCTTRKLLATPRGTRISSRLLDRGVSYFASIKAAPPPPPPLP
jgi:hypothetical protein